MRVTARAVSVAEGVGVSWALGLALLTIVLFILNVCHINGVGATYAGLVLTLIGIGGGIIALRHARRVDTRVSRQGPSRQGLSWIATIGVAIAAAQIALSCWLALRAPLVPWDAWAIWAFKGRMFAAGGLDLSYFHASSTAFSHPDYPLLLPLLEGTLFRLTGASGTVLAALVSPACLAALALLFFAGLSRLYGCAIGAVTTGLLTLAPALPRQAANGYADIPLAMYDGGAALYLLLWWRLRRPADAILMGLFAGGALWTKKEGAVAAGLILFVYIVGEAWRQNVSWRERLQNVVYPLLATMIVAAPWWIFTRLVHPIGGDFLPLTPATFLANVSRIPHIAELAVAQLLTFSAWSLLWIVLLGSVLVAARRLPIQGWALLGVLLGQMVIYLLSYVFSSWQPYTLHIATSFDRLVAQTVPVAVLVLLQAGEALSGLARGARPDTTSGRSVSYSGATHRDVA